jgi:hypothetical protein
MKNKELNLLVCGSQRFDDKNFVFGILDAFSKMFEQDMGQPITNIITSRFSGACQYAREWVDLTNDMNAKHRYQIGVKDCNFDDLLESKNISLYEQIELPDYILQADPFFQKGKDKLKENQVEIVVAFPNPENILGPATLNIQRFAQLANIPHFDSSQALEMITHCRQEESGLYVPQETTVKTTDGLVNRHPSKKF